MFSKSVQRVSSSTSRMAKRFTSSRSGSEGATAASGSFGQKEKAVENVWARSHDAEKLKLLREALAKQEKDTAALKKDLEALEQKHTSK
ncbi:hypothetical protein BDF21DRAFT_495084 [Thamnidium elegans]|uniref:ATPase inhibitor, mitochondrial n=1 Tax=Thamnidium elegans TaxID=101142 RepID=A0A8H7VWB9_9FUNG|nr:hypothetical protein INT48_005965 [Thamnidium elegans]KAI8075575.1 hypothetical protein BDF21DRAFT_495084 [Thamnidium elegans]